MHMNIYFIIDINKYIYEEIKRFTIRNWLPCLWRLTSPKICIGKLETQEGR